MPSKQHKPSTCSKDSLLFFVFELTISCIKHKVDIGQDLQSGNLNDQLQKSLTMLLLHDFVLTKHFNIIFTSNFF